MKNLCLIALLAASAAALAQGNGVHIAIPQTGSTSTEAAMTFDSDPRTITMSCSGGFQAENFYSINCVTEGSAWATLDISNVFNQEGTLHVVGMSDKKVTCHMLHDGQPAGPVQCDSVSSFHVAAMAQNTAGAGGTDGLDQDQARNFMNALNASGVPMKHRFTIGGGFSQLAAQSINCVLSVSAPLASFVPNCTVLDQNGNSHRVLVSDFQEVVQALEHAGFLPTQQGSDLVLKTGSVGCFSESNVNQSPSFSANCNFQ